MPLKTSSDEEFSISRDSLCPGFWGAVDLLEAMEELRRFRLKQSFPELTEADIDDKINQWMTHRPQAPIGDASGSDFKTRLLITKRIDVSA